MAARDQIQQQTVTAIVDFLRDGPRTRREIIEAVDPEKRRSSWMQMHLGLMGVDQIVCEHRDDHRWELMAGVDTVRVSPFGFVERVPT